jgi:hypothetical protein
MPAPPRASPTIRFRGKEIFRATGFLKGRKILCPDQHVVRADSIVREGVLFCDHKAGPGYPPCGALIYLLVMPSHGDPTHRIWLADVTREEWKEIESLHLDADGVLAYFGAQFARGAAA